MTSVSIGLAGCGRWGRNVLRDLLALGCDVTVADPSPESRERALQAGASRAVPSARALPAVQGTVVATTTSTHRSVLEELLERGLPVFCEKPLTADPVSARRLAESAPENLFVMHKWRYHPGVELLGELARSGELGPVVGLRTKRVQWGTGHRDVDAIWILAPHDLSISVEVLGSVLEPRSAVADWAGGEPGGLYALLGREPWHVLEVSARDGESERRISLHCREGVAVLDLADPCHVEVLRPQRSDPTKFEREMRRVSGELPLLRELRTFVGYLRGGPPPKSSAREGASVVETVAALRRLAGIKMETARP